MAALVDFAARAFPVKVDASARPIATAAPLSSVRREIFFSRPSFICVPPLDMLKSLTSEGLPANYAPSAAKLYSLHLLRFLRSRRHLGPLFSGLGKSDRYSLFSALNLFVRPCRSSVLPS